ncbi:E3 ubiquitin-protein ligase RMA1H1 [Linum grandiflorum]
MAFEQYYAQEWKSVASAAATAQQTTLTDCFDCNICFDFAQEPVVTLCGHLYCWPCIYKWLHVQTSSSSDRPQCPVCKADISHTTMVPLYGRGGGGQSSEPEQPELQTKPSTGINGIAIPPRPPAYGCTQALTSVNHNQSPMAYRSFNNGPSSSSSSSSPLVNLRGERGPPTGFHHPAFGVFGEFVYARVFGNSDNLYTYPNSYQFATSSSSRLRRHEMQAEKSLNRISIFLFCCFLLCLIVF